MIGSNLLNIALRATGKQKANLLRYEDSVTNGLGQDVPSYSEPIQIVGSWQPVDSRRVKELGLDLRRQYFNFYTSTKLNTVKDDQGSDFLIYHGKKYEVVSIAPWNTVDGWNAVMVVEHE